MAASRRELLSEGAQWGAAELRQAWLDLHESWLGAKSAELGITDADVTAAVTWARRPPR